jgi:hypothetical protein
MGVEKKTVLMTCGKLTVEVPNFISTGSKHPIVHFRKEDLDVLARILVAGDRLQEAVTVNYDLLCKQLPKKPSDFDVRTAIEKLQPEPTSSAKAILSGVFDKITKSQGHTPEKFGG